MSSFADSPFNELKKMLLIINPVSGRKTAARHIAEIVSIFNEAGWAVTLFITKSCGDAEKYTYLHADKFNAVVCIGGDGTLNEVVCGLISNSADIPLGYIPAGSTNVFAECHNISSDIPTAAKSIVSGHIKEIDIGALGEKYFSFIASFGLFSRLSYTTPQSMKNILGHSAYLLDAVKDLPKLKSERIKFIADDCTHEGSYIFGAICNTNTVAGTFTFPTELVDTGDGKFEVLLVHKPHNFLDFQAQVNGVFTHDYSSPYIDFFQTDSLIIDAPDSLEWAIDGERYIGNSPIRVTNMKRKLKLLV